MSDRVDPYCYGPGEPGGARPPTPGEVARAMGAGTLPATFERDGARWRLEVGRIEHGLDTYYAMVWYSPATPEWTGMTRDEALRRAWADTKEAP